MRGRRFPPAGASAGMIIYGVNPVLEAIRSHPDRVHYVGVAREHGRKCSRRREAKKAGVPVRMLPVEQIDRLATHGVHNGVVADISSAGYADLEEVLNRPETNFV